DAIEGVHPVTEEKVVRNASVIEPFAALSFQIATDPFVSRLAFFRSYSGRLDAGSYVLITSSGNKERISCTFQLHSKKQVLVDYIEAGDIGAAVGFKDIKAGDTL